MVVDVAVAVICVGTSDCNSPTEIQLLLYEELELLESELILFLFCLMKSLMLKVRCGRGGGVIIQSSCKIDSLIV